MKRFHLLFLLSVGFLLGTQLAMASTVEVGTCRNGLTQFATISAAVASVPSGSTVLVCPGTYAEQVVISTPLTLEGISSGNSGRAIIASPPGGVAFSFTSPIDGAVVAAQVFVTTGPVNITNITVDGTGNGITSGWIAGIAYESGASGTVNGVTAREQIGVTHGVGFWAENADSTSKTVTIENSQVHDADHTGMIVRSGITPPTLVAKVVGNQMINMPYGIRGNPAGSIMGNVIADHSAIGIQMTGGATASVVGNVISSTLGSSNPTGIEVDGTGEIVKSNTMLDENGSASGVGINVTSASGATVQANKITDASIGIQFGCKAGNTVSGNTLNDVTLGLGSVPTGLVVNGKFQNVDALRSGGC